MNLDAVKRNRPYTSTDHQQCSGHEPRVLQPLGSICHHMWSLSLPSVHLCDNFLSQFSLPYTGTKQPGEDKLLPLLYPLVRLRKAFKIFPR